MADELVLERWPKSFEVACMLSDNWNQGRVFSGQLGDVRFSKTVRYDRPFDPAQRLGRDQHTVLIFQGERIPLGN